jgi:hypothetical protein
MARARRGPPSEQPGVTLFGQVLPVVAEAAILIAFGLVKLSVATVNFRHRD